MTSQSNPAPKDAFLQPLQDFAAAVAAKSNALTTGEPEDQLRAPFEALMSAVGQAVGPEVVCTGETLLSGRLGKPDYAVHASGALAGCVELKAPGKGANPNAYKGHDRRQWKRFQAIPNLIYTDGSEWALYRSGAREGAIVRLSGDVAAEGKKAVEPDDARRVLALLTDFLSWSPIIPTDRKGKLDLKGFAAMLAPLCGMVRDNVTDALKDATSPLVRLAKDWRQLLFPDADDEQFADAYAQTVTFALLLARSEGAAPLSLAEAEKALSGEHSLLSRALQVLTDPKARAEISASVDLLIRVIGEVAHDALKAETGKRDPWLFFYEDFLAAYDPKLRKDAGAYYTPVEVVRAQVRLIDELLTNRLGKPLGFAEPGVVTLDPAAGTGTYLLGVIDHALNKVEAQQGAGAVPGKATELARNIYGFEIMVGPFAVTELRVSRALQDRGATLPADGTHVYLTDTLESPHAVPPQVPMFLEPIAEQQKKALKVKGKVPVIVCLGNPPYDRHEAADATNKARTGHWVRWGDDGKGAAAILKDFLTPAIDAGHGGHVKNLYNLYIYFWRWALWKVFESKTAAGPGVVSFISASSYLDGDAFVGVREHMRRVCDEVWILDLGGEGRGTRQSENVFDIQTPVAIAVAVRGGTGFRPVGNHGQDAHATNAHGQDARATDDAPLQIRRGAYLPHWTKQGAVYSVAFRLADSLPRALLEAWVGEREDIIATARQMGRPLSEQEERRLQDLFSEKVEKHLDAGHGACWMARDDIARIVADVLRQFDEERYRLFAWCVMPNHVHVVLQPLAGHELPQILHSWKSFTANAANKALERKGSFWQPEYYDHLIRNEEDLWRSIQYVLQNPAGARLQGWKWVERGTGFQPVGNHGQDAHATSRPARVHYTRIEGTREEKLKALDAARDFAALTWEDCPDDWHAPFRPAGSGFYFDWPLLTDVLPWQQSGVKAGRTWSIAPTTDVLERRWRALCNAEKDRRPDLFKDSPTGRKTTDAPSQLPPRSEKLKPVAQLPKDAPAPNTARYAYRSFDRQHVFADARMLDRAGPALWAAHGERQVYVTTLLNHPLGSGPALTAAPNIPDLHHFRGSYGAKEVVPLYRDAEGAEPNILPGLLGLLAEGWHGHPAHESRAGSPCHNSPRHKSPRHIAPEDFLAYVYGVLAQPAFTERFREELGTRELRVPITKDAELFERVRAAGARLLWLHTYGERYVPEGRKRGQVPQGAARCTVPVPGDAEHYPEDCDYNEETKTLHVGKGRFAPVEREVYEFEVSGLKVVQSWLGYRMKEPKGRRSSPLDDINVEEWPAQFTTELLELLWVLEATVEGYPEQEELLDEILAGPLFTADELPDVPDKARKPPKRASGQQPLRKQP